jgi:hypothetical protein
MSEDREKFIKKNIRRLTSEIGKARKDHSRAELDNRRTERANFARQLAEEFNEYFIIGDDGKTKFVPMEEAHEHYENPEVRKRIQGGGIVQQVYEQRMWFKSQQLAFQAMSDADMRKAVDDLFGREVKERETYIHKVQKDIGEELIDFDVVDTRAAESKKDLEGIDLSFLTEKKDGN